MYKQDIGRVFTHTFQAWQPNTVETEKNVKQHKKTFIRIVTGYTNTALIA